MQRGRSQVVSISGSTTSAKFFSAEGELMDVISTDNEKNEREELRRTPLDFSRHKQRLQTGNGEGFPERGGPANFYTIPTLLCVSMRSSDLHVGSDKGLWRQRHLLLGRNMVTSCLLCALANVFDPRDSQALVCNAALLHAAIPI